MFRPIALLALLLASGLPACTASLDEDVEQSDGALSADTAIADMDATGRVSVRAGVLTLGFVGAGTFETRAGERTLVLRGTSSRNLKEVRSFVPDDAFGEATLTGPRSFEVALRGGHEINSILSGLPLGLSIVTQNGSPKTYEAAVHLGGQLAATGGDSRLRVVPAMRAVHAGSATDPLRYRARLELTKTPDAVTVAGATASRASARRYDVDWTYDALAAVLAAPNAATSFVATYGASTSTTTARIDLSVVRLGLTTKSLDEAWPPTCPPAVRRCVDRATSALATCGTYREVTRCADEEPPPPPAVTQAAARIRADVLAKTGETFQPSIFEVRQESGRTIALTSVGNGSAEFALDGSGVSLVRFVDRPVFVDTNLVERFEKQLRLKHGMPNARIIAHGTPAGGTPLWHFIVDRGGVRSTVALQATSESTSVIAPFAYDANAFREMAGHLAVAHALEMATQAGIYAELEVYLRAIRKLSTGLVPVTVADSPVGFNPATETQLGLYSIWGDNAVFVTQNRTTGATRVEDFN